MRVNYKEGLILAGREVHSLSSFRKYVVIHYPGKAKRYHVKTYFNEVTQRLQTTHDWRSLLSDRVLTNSFLIWKKTNQNKNTAF